MRSPHLRTTDIALATALAGALVSGGATAQDFSIDAASPEVPGVMTAADAAMTPGIPPVPLTFVGASFIGMPPGVEVDAMSYGVDQANPLGDTSFMELFTSVTRGSVGAPGSAVAGQTNGVGGDRYTCLANTVGGFGAQTLATDAPLLGLSIAPAVESNIDALAHPPAAALVVGAYVSVSAASAPVLGADQASILYNGPLNLPPGSPAILFATSGALGLVPGADEIDALIMNDKSPKTVFDATDIIYVSLAPGSPTLATLGASPADLIQVAPGPPTVVVTAAQLGLLPTDDLDGATIWDPGPWSTLGGGKAGSGGVQPAIWGGGPMTAGSLNELSVRGAPPFATSILVLGLGTLYAPLKGGVLIPSADVLLDLPPAGPDGALTVPFVWPVGFPPGVPIFLQAWVFDGGASFGLSASNGEQGVAQ
jgi:hypothetical protein